MIRKIVNGRIYDGSGTEPFLGSIELEAGRIVRVRAGAEKAEGPEIIDAHGMAVTPGFVDIHRHHDIAALYDDHFGELELAQGITTAIAGNCGLSPFPNHPQRCLQQFAYIEPCLGKMPSDTKLHLFSDYMEALAKKQLPLNVGALVGAGACAAAAMGYEARGFTPAEREEAIAYVRDAMQSGALGMSFGIMYTPECYLAEEDMVAMARECARQGGMVSCHIRGEGNGLVDSVREILTICKKAEAPLNISHFKATGIANWGRNIGQAIEEIEKARSAGQRVTVDVYPYTGGATTALSLIPPCVTEGRPLSYLGTPEGAARLRQEIEREQPGWDNMVKSIGWERTIIGSVTKEKNRRYCGKSVAAIMQELALEDPCEWLGQLIAEEEGKVGCIIMSMSQEDVDTVMRLPYAAIISDSLYGGGDNPHPRLYGSFPRVLREYVRERGILSMQEAVRKMTAMPAERAGILDRGYIRAGYMADINIFDPEKIRDLATFTEPKQLSEGIAYTLIGGEQTGAGARGRLIKKGKGLWNQF
ncbi:MAG: amidohydrolase family protein [Lachnospiraceae bacterium]|jgi:N-acyl-D-amino-acid deacylase|nr:amidohydrolase family protein [Lachnospiraceae bacterium]